MKENTEPDKLIEQMYKNRELENDALRKIIINLEQKSQQRTNGIKNSKNSLFARFIKMIGIT